MPRTHGVYESRPRRYANLHAALAAYAEQKRIAGESIPTYPGRAGTPDYRVVAEDLGIDYEREWLGRVNALRHVQQALAGIPLGAPTRTAADEMAARIATKEKFAAFDAALTAMERSQKPLPESLLKPGQPDFDAIGAMFDVVPLRFQHKNNWRKRLLQAIDVVGLERRSFILGDADFTLSYSDLIKEVALRRKDETKATQTSAQAVTNAKYVLKTLMAARGRTEEDDCTEDFGEHFQASVKIIEERCNSQNTKKKQRSELNRIHKYYEDLERQACHPPTLSAALENLMEKSRLSFLAIERQTGCKAETVRQWVYHDCQPSSDNERHLRNLERFFGLTANTLTRFINPNSSRFLSQRDVETAAQSRVDARCLPHLPDNFAERPLKECREIIDFVMNSILKQSREEHYLERIGDMEEFQLRLEKWPERMVEQWNVICNTKQDRILPDDIYRRRGAMWTEGGKQVMLSRLQGYFGYLTLSEKRGGKALPGHP